jgi:ATP-dependent exoDNAse (exonuclease V) alpha subunit
MANALNRRIHHGTIDPTAPTVRVAQGQRIAVGDTIISRRNDPAIPVLDATRSQAATDPVRNGNRWRVYAIDQAHGRIAARRLNDDARAVFAGDYLREHITYGYAVTAHSAQGVTADTTHTVLGENATRAMLYVAMTRGRESNTAYLCQRTASEADHQHREHEDMHVSPDARHHRSRRAPRPAHDVSATTEREILPNPVGFLVDRRKKATERRRTDYADWQKTQTMTSDTE